MKKAYWIDGHLLTERDLQDIRAQLQAVKRVTGFCDEMRDAIETEWAGNRSGAGMRTS